VSNRVTSTRGLVLSVVVILGAACSSSPSPTTPENLETNSLAPVVEVILTDAFKVDMTTVDTIWLACSGFESPIPTSVAGRQVRQFEVGSKDPFGGQANWSDKPLVLHIVLSRAEQDMMILDAMRKFGGCDFARTLELRRTDGKWRISKTIAESRRIG
jgi:hypothetical protein